MRVLQNGITKTAGGTVAGRVGACGACRCVIELEPSDEDRPVVSRRHVTVSGIMFVRALVVACPECESDIELVL